MSSLQRTTLEKNCPQRHRSQAMDLKAIRTEGARGSHTAPILFTPEEPWILIIVCVYGRGEVSDNFLLDTRAAYFVFTEGPGPLSSLSASMMGLSGWAKCYCFSCPLSSNWDSVPFSHKFLIVPESPSPPFGEGYTEQGPCLYFHKYGAFSFSPINWAKCKC